MKTMKSLAKEHATWIVGAAFIIYGLFGYYLHQQSQAEFYTNVLAGLGMLGVHFKTQ